jgi:hypothetical protein
MYKNLGIRGRKEGAGGYNKGGTRVGAVAVRRPLPDQLWAIAGRLVIQQLAVIGRTAPQRAACHVIFFKKMLKSAICSSLSKNKKIYFWNLTVGSCTRLL